MTRLPRFARNDKLKTHPVPRRRYFGKPQADRGQ